MKTTRFAAILFLLLCPLAGTALPWGDAPTHPSIAATIVSADFSTPILWAEIGDYQRFVRSSSCPDIAETQLFRSNGFGYVHTEEFADILRDIALSDRRFMDDKNVSSAYAWGVHIAADETGHSSYVPPSQPLHSLVEVSVDTVIYYDPANYQRSNPNNLLKLLGFSRWEDTVAGGDDCSPALVAAASALYRQKIDPSVKTISAWQAWWATQSLGVSLRAEYDYIRAKRSDRSSEAFLASLGLLPFTDPYEASVENARNWISEK